MGNRNRRKPKEKPAINWKSWLLGAITDLTIGIILIIIDKLLK